MLVHLIGPPNPFATCASRPASMTAVCSVIVSTGTSRPRAQVARRRQEHAGLPLAREVMRWLFTGKGMLTYSPSIVAASATVSEESATPDMQVTFAPGSFKMARSASLRRRPASAPALR
jgi:hypothetical protein